MRPGKFAVYVDRVRVARDAVAARDRALWEAFPLGGEVRWDHHGHDQSGIVILHGADDRLKVRNDKTDKVVWITGYDVRLSFGLQA